MPKKRQIPRLFPRQKADGTTVWDWKPSKTLRAAGFVNIELGANQRHAIDRALELNDQVETWRTGTAATPGTVPPPRPLPRIVRVAELIQRYRKSDAFTTLRPKTQTNYNTYLTQMQTWALDGTLPVRDVDRQAIRDLRTGLMTGSVWKAASTLRVLRILLGFAVDEGIIATNPAEKIDIPEQPARKTRMPTPIRDAIVEAALALDPDDDDGIALAIELAFWMLQRQADILQLNRFAWREVHDPEADPRHVAMLADPRGRVMAFRLCQQKTGTWVDAPLPPMFHARIEARMKRGDNGGGWLFAHPDRPADPIPNWMFQRRFRAARDAAAAVAIMRGDMALAEAIDACQFRDLRRTGMIAYKNAGVKVPSITALSGHYVIGKKTILDTYMPGDTAGAIACVAQGLAHWQRRQQQELAI